MFNIVFIKDSAERAVKTFAQTILGTVVGSEVLPITDIDWGQGALIGLTAAAISVLTSIVSGVAVKGNGTASLVSEVVAEPTYR